MIYFNKYLVTFTSDFSQLSKVFTSFPIITSVKLILFVLSVDLDLISRSQGIKKCEAAHFLLNIVQYRDDLSLGDTVNHFPILFHAYEC